MEWSKVQPSCSINFASVKMFQFICVLLWLRPQLSFDGSRLILRRSQVLFQERVVPALRRTREKLCRADRKPGVFVCAVGSALGGKYGPFLVGRDGRDLFRALS